MTDYLFSQYIHTPLLPPLTVLVVAVCCYFPLVVAFLLQGVWGMKDGPVCAMLAVVSLRVLGVSCFRCGACIGACFVEKSSSRRLFAPWLFVKTSASMKMLLKLYPRRGDLAELEPCPRCKYFSFSTPFLCCLIDLANRMKFWMCVFTFQFIIALVK